MEEDRRATLSISRGKFPETRFDTPTPKNVVERRVASERMAGIRRGKEK